ncbi:MAG TPA: ATP-binding cassette domain-containing protein, partial [Clostridia bacterium]|nr:ATP-binding cassette domain-containing protein [Clostridia bacterium]
MANVSLKIKNGIKSLLTKVKRYFFRLKNSIVKAAKETALFFKNPRAYIKAAIQRKKDIINDVYEPVVHDSENILEVNALKMFFPIKKGFFKRTVGYVKAVDGITFNIKRGTTMGLVGESGCGKTTVGRTVLRLYERTGGEVLFDGIDINKLKKKELRQKRPEIQIVFQDPYSSLSPRLPVGEIIGEAVREHKIVPKAEFDDYITSI